MEQLLSNVLNLSREVTFLPYSLQVTPKAELDSLEEEEIPILIEELV